MLHLLLPFSSRMSLASSSLASRRSSCRRRVRRKNKNSSRDNNNITNHSKSNSSTSINNNNNRSISINSRKWRWRRGCSLLEHCPWRREITNTQSAYSLIARMVLDLDTEMSAKNFFNVSLIAVYIRISRMVLTNFSFSYDTFPAFNTKRLFQARWIQFL